MNINNKEFSEIFPLNPPQDGYSFRKGFPIIQFQIANQSKLLDGRSLRLNGDITLFSPSDELPTNQQGLSPSPDNRTGIALNNRVGVASCLHQITTSTMSNQTLETIRSYGRFLASSLPVTHSQADFDGGLAQTNALNASRSYNGARAANVTTGFSIPLRTGLFTGGNLIPLGQNGVQGLNITLELGDAGFDSRPPAGGGGFFPKGSERRGHGNFEESDVSAINIKLGGTVGSRLRFDHKAKEKRAAAAAAEEDTEVSL